jgi:hypothetical protein
LVILALEIGVEHFLQLFLRKRLAGQRVEHDLARRNRHANQEVAGEGNTLERQADLLAEFHVEDGQRDRNTPALLEHHVQVRIVRIVVVVRVGAEAEIAIEEMIEQAQALDGRRSLRDPALQAQGQNIQGCQFGLQVQVRIGVLGDRQRGLGERDRVVVGHEAGEVVQDFRGGHGGFLTSPRGAGRRSSAGP